MLTMPQKMIRQLIKGLDRIQPHNKKRRQIHRHKKVELGDRKGKENNGSRRCTTDASYTRQSTTQQPQPPQQPVIQPVPLQPVTPASMANNWSYFKM